ncbi:histidine-containing phosphotransfer protein 2-like, partial [Triticum dicoccoides]|uniref:histidine-containing phosphotransfer protein 2-like n=1 Tax=Triticum dicoccoides TaxID=85692 RepID=UPI00188EAC9C
MSAAELRSQLNTRVSYMYAMGILDEYYQELQPPQDEGFVPEVINMFLHEADMMLNDITSLLNLPVVNFEMVGELVHQLKEYSG